ncbi:MAG: response regulator transcription factor [Thermoanaerobaculia bacterium]
MKLLLIEDSERLQRSLQRGLRKLGFAVDAATNGEDGLWLATQNDYDVVLLDIMLPGLDGFSLLQQLRERGRQQHVLILSARDLVEDRVRGLDLGADDYLVKPFAFEELVARIHALVRREFSQKNPHLEVGGLRIETSAHRVWAGEREIPLSPREYSLLELLARRAGELVTRRELWEQMYEFEAGAESNVMEVMIYSLRRKLAEAGVAATIHTRRGEGYLLDHKESA